MARATYGAGLDNLSGTVNRTLGGWTFQKNLGVVRKRVIPNQPNTAEQARVKAFISAASSYWGETLDASQRQSWIDAAASTEWMFPDRLTGVMRNRSGFQLFMALNGNLAYVNQNAAVAIDEVPLKEPVGTAYITAVNVETDGTVELTYAGALAANEIAVIEMSAPQAPGRMSLRLSKTPFLAVKSSATPFVVTTEYGAKYGSLTGLVGYNVYYQVLAINNVTGQKTTISKGVTQIVSS